MVLIIVILSFTLGAVYISTSNRLIRESNDMLQKTIEQENEIHKNQIDISHSNEDAPPPPQIFSFAVQLDKNNSITDVFYNNMDKINTDTVITLINYTLADNNLAGIVQNWNCVLPFESIAFEEEKKTDMA